MMDRACSRHVRYFRTKLFVDIEQHCPRGLWHHGLDELSLLYGCRHPADEIGGIDRDWADCGSANSNCGRYDN